MRWNDTRSLFESWAEQVRSRVEERSEETKLKSFEGGLPFASIRTKQEGEWIGEIGVCRWEFREVGDEDERARRKRENDDRRVGDPELVWSFGC
jgi:hypothetical protein